MIIKALIGLYFIYLIPKIIEEIEELEDVKPNEVFDKLKERYETHID